MERREQRDAPSRHQIHWESIAKARAEDLSGMLDFRLDTTQYS